MNPADDITALEVGFAVLEALDPNEELTQEELDVRAWRFEQLVDHGYEVDDAMELARARHVDLEQARTLVAKRGCPPALAARILL
jgi:hypothetical protein